jgi:ABC-type transport system involved in multi-copper enzyme maturation permease subunit
MIETIQQYFTQYQDIFIWLGIISLITFIASIVLIPLVIKRMPVDYFTNVAYHTIDVSSVYKLTMFLIKNMIGLVLIIAGIIMLITPGQGIISIIIGLFLMQFKYKYKLEQKLIANDMTFKGLNWIRKKSNQKPFLR